MAEKEQDMLEEIAELEQRARAVEGDSDNPLRVAAANELWERAAALRASSPQEGNEG